MISEKSAGHLVEWGDLEIVYDFLAQKSHQAAKHVVENIIEKVAQLENFPESGLHQEKIINTLKEYRYLVEGNYKIIYTYQAEQQVIYIEVIFDTRLNPDKLKL